MRNFIFIALAFLYFSCTKQQDIKSDGANKSGSSATASSAQVSREASTTFRKFTIKKGAHYCDQSTLSHVSGTSMSFVAKFDSTAIYPAVILSLIHISEPTRLLSISYAVFCL